MSNDLTFQTTRCGPAGAAFGPQAAFFSSGNARRGLYQLAILSRAARLLVPHSLLPWVREMKSGKVCVITAGILLGDEAVELLFDDGSSRPFSIHLEPHQVCGCVDELPESFRLNAWSPAGLEHSWTAHFRKGRFNLPCLRPWTA